ALVRMFKCVKLHSNELNLSSLSLGSVPPLPEWIEILSLVYNELDSIQVPESCKELELDFNNLTEFPQVPDGITLISVNNNLISHIEYNKIEVIPAIPGNLKLLFMECNPIKEAFLMPWALTGICYEISQRKYIVTNPDDYDKYSDMVKKYVIDGEELIIKYYM
ncbi:leucine-rich repeat domain-containing protein, partial [Escherichia coli]